MDTYAGVNDENISDLSERLAQMDLETHTEGKNKSTLGPRTADEAAAGGLRELIPPVNTKRARTDAMNAILD